MIIRFLTSKIHLLTGKLVKISFMSASVSGLPSLRHAGDPESKKNIRSLASLRIITLLNLYKSFSTGKRFLFVQ